MVALAVPVERVKREDKHAAGARLVMALKVAKAVLAVRAGTRPRSCSIGIHCVIRCPTQARILDFALRENPASELKQRAEVQVGTEAMVHASFLVRVVLDHQEIRVGGDWTGNRG